VNLLRSFLLQLWYCSLRDRFIRSRGLDPQELASVRFIYEFCKFDWLIDYYYYTCIYIAHTFNRLVILWYWIRGAGSHYRWAAWHGTTVILYVIDLYDHVDLIYPQHLRIFNQWFDVFCLSDSYSLGAATSFCTLDENKTDRCVWNVAEVC